MYEKLLSVPGMNDTVKVDLRLPRRTILYLVQVLEKGMETENNVPSFGPDGSDLEQVIADCLSKAGLTDRSAYQPPASGGRMTEAKKWGSNIPPVSK